MRRHAMGAPFTKALEGVKAGTGASLPPMVLPYRAKEATFIKPGNDRWAHFFSTPPPPPGPPATR